MRELLQQALDALNWICEHPEEPSIKVLDAIESIESALSRSKWVKVSDGLPVVPEGFHSVDVWEFSIGGEILKAVYWAGETKADLSQRATHWQYRQDDTPAPPEDV